MQLLQQAGRQIDAALGAARRAAGSARADGGAQAAAPFERAVDGLRAQHAVVNSALAQLAGLRGGAESNAKSAADLVRANGRRLQQSLGEQLALLGQLDELERRRALARLRRR